MIRARRSKLTVSRWLLGTTLLATAPIACGDDESEPDEGGSPAGEAGEGGSGGSGGTKTSGGSSSGRGGAQAGGAEAGQASTGGSASGAGGETGGEGGSSSGQAGLGGGEGEAGAGGAPELVNLVGDGWVSSEGPFSPDNLFDRSDWFWLCLTPGWAQYEFIEKPASIQSYGFISGPIAPERDPKSWVLLGNDTGPDDDESSDSEWTVLDVQTDQGPFPERKQRYTYPIANPGAYKYYRIKFAGSSGSAIQLSELELLGR